MDAPRIVRVAVAAAATVILGVSSFVGVAAAAPSSDVSLCAPVEVALQGVSLLGPELARQAAGPLLGSDGICPDTASLGGVDATNPWSREKAGGPSHCAVP